MECRFYSKELPEIEDVVLVQVKSLSDIGAYVTLLEYGKLEGMIQISEMSNRRIRSISKLTRAGNIEVCMVLRVDADRGYIDLSKKRVRSGEDVIRAKEAFAKAKTVHGIMRHIATIVKQDLASVCEIISWPLYKALGPAKAYDALRRMVHENSTDGVFAVCTELASRPALVEALLLAAGRKLTPQEVRVRALFDLQCFASDGVLAIKAAVAAVQAALADQGLTIKVISAPQFLVETAGIGREACEGRVLAALEKLKQEMETRGGVYRLRAAPEVIGDDEEALPKFEDEDFSSDDDEENVEKSDDSDSDSDSSSSSSSSSSSEDEKEKKRGKKDKKSRK